MREWGWLLSATVALVVIAAGNVPVLRWLTIPWYESPPRLLHLITIVEAGYAAIAIAAIYGWAMGSLTGRSVRVAMVTIAGGVVVIVVVEGIQSATFARRGYETSSVVGSDERAAFAWLAR